MVESNPQDPHYHIERLDSAVGEIRGNISTINDEMVGIKTDLAGMPGKFIQILDQREAVRPKRDSGTLLLASWGAGAIGWLLVIVWAIWTMTTGADETLSASLIAHTGDQHPARVEAKVTQLDAKFVAFKEQAHEDYLRREEFRTTDAKNRIDVAKELASHRVVIAKNLSDTQLANARELGGIEARLKANDDKFDLVLTALVEAMRNTGQSGRATAETRGRTAEAIKALRESIKAVSEEQSRRSQRVYSNNHGN